MPGFGGLAAPAAALWRAAFTGQGLYWRARYGAQNDGTYGIVPPDTSDPHSTEGVARCSVCWNATLQRAASSECTTCFGTGWTGGFAATQAFSGLIAGGTMRLRMQETGDLLAVDGTWLYCDPTIGLILPQDLIASQTAPGVRYLVGETAQFPGLGGVTYGRVLQLLPLAPDNPLQLVPIP